MKWKWTKRGRDKNSTIFFNKHFLFLWRGGGRRGARIHTQDFFSDRTLLILSFFKFWISCPGAAAWWFYNKTTIITTTRVKSKLKFLFESFLTLPTLFPCNRWEIKNKKKKKKNHRPHQKRFFRKSHQRDQQNNITNGFQIFFVF